MEENLLKNLGLSIIEAALIAVSPEKVIADNLTLTDNTLWVHDRAYNLLKFKKICVIGAGKASAGMAKALEKVLGSRIHSGLVVVKYKHVVDTKFVEIQEASHPVPDKNSVLACKNLIAYISHNRSPETLFISLLSGGASSLLAAPIKGISLTDKQNITNLLLECGATIQEINTIRKHLSNIKGGRLATQTHPAHVINLIISDVIGDDLESIGSAPFTGDSGTWKDCLAILNKYNITAKVPKPVYQKIVEGLHNSNNETPKPGKGCFNNIFNAIIGSNNIALNAAADKAQSLGFTPHILPYPIAGDTQKAAEEHINITKDIIIGKGLISRPCCLISGGETTVTLGDNYGKGGRNQEFALYAIKKVSGIEDLILFSVGTDGNDGPTDAAGAYVTGETLNLAKNENLDPNIYLKNHDSYTFFSKIGNLVYTGPTMTNVMDIHIIVLNTVQK